ncbi:MAG: TetR/AcrR family transcriptional regulator [Pseudomonadota bacterium]
MSDSNEKKQTWLLLMAGHVVENGLAGASLRPLAKAAGTSDRMLIYHFGSKDGLIDALLRCLAERFTQALDAALPPGHAPNRAACLAEITALMRQPQAAAFAHVWLDILAEAARGTTVFQTTAAAIIEGFLDWIVGRLPEDDPDPATGAAVILAHIEGALVLTAAGRPDVAERVENTLF